MMNWKDKLRYGMSKMLYGRYGMDELGRFLWAAVIVLQPLCSQPDPDRAHPDRADLDVRPFLFQAL